MFYKNILMYLLLNRNLIIKYKQQLMFKCLFCSVGPGNRVRVRPLPPVSSLLRWRSGRAGSCVGASVQLQSALSRVPLPHREQRLPQGGAGGAGRLRPGGAGPAG